MKKLILAAAMMIGFIGFSTAQKKAAHPAATAKKVTPAATKQAVKPAPAAAPVAAKGVVLKKDGTPDKRYNHTAAKEKGPLKKDGTPDKRYKANKKG